MLAIKSQHFTWVGPLCLKWANKCTQTDELQGKKLSPDLYLQFHFVKVQPHNQRDYYNWP